MISRRECTDAVTKAQKKYRGLIINENLAYLVLTYMERNLEKKELFGQAMRLALNEACLPNKPVRSAYASVIGHYFGPHSLAARRRKAWEI